MKQMQNFKDVKTKLQDEPRRAVEVGLCEVTLELAGWASVDSCFRGPVEKRDLKAITLCRNHIQIHTLPPSRGLGWCFCANLDKSLQIPFVVVR